MRAHNKVWLVGATFAVGSLAVLVLVTSRLGQEAAHLATVQQQEIPQQQRLNRVVRDLSASRAALTDAARSPDATERARHLRRSLDSGASASAAWKNYLALPLRLPDERAVRARFSAAAAVADESGHATNLAIVNAPQGAIVADSTALATELDAVDTQIGAATTLQRAIRARTTTTIAGEQDELDAAKTLAPFAVALSLLLGLVVTAACARSVRRQEATLRRQEAERDETAKRNAFDASLGRALEMAASEARAFDVIEQAVSDVVADDAAEVLLADSSRAHFRRVLATRADMEGCGVTTPSDCPSARRGTTLVFPSSGNLDACPHLHDLERSCSAVCLPVTVGSQAVGVIHVSAPDQRPPDATRVLDLELVARKAGDRVGMLRAFADSESQARTDPLTGLLNRRSLENRVRELVADGISYVVAYGDLDNFKILNDTHGHETGDRALRLFARVLRDSIRPSDIPGRFGGEEFLVVLPECTVEGAVSVIERVREQLALALTNGELQPFTVSFGVAGGRPGTGFDDVVAEADAAMFEAKRAGRNRVVGAGESSGSGAAPTADVH
jgi:diguanylate cyclase (GGDEF)-like protein